MPDKVDPTPGHQSLEALASYYAEQEKSDLQPAANPAPVDVVVGALMTAHHQAFAHTLASMTGWQTMIAFAMPRSCRIDPNLTVAEDGSTAAPTIVPLHSLVRAPDGRLVDASGWVTERDLARRYGVKHLSLAEIDAEALARSGQNDNLAQDGDGSLYDIDQGRIVSALRRLPHPPFADDCFREITGRPVPGVDLPKARASRG